MPVDRKFAGLKDELVKIITENIGGKTADMYCDFYDDNTPAVSLDSAEDLLIEFIGQQRTKEKIAPLRSQYSLSKVPVV